jgi:2-iminobutanoate/2-iminopropanoate deaminase
MSKIKIYTPNAPEPIGPYNQAILADNMLYISGQIPIDPATNQVVEGSITDQTHLVMKNLGNILDEAGMEFSNVVKTSIFIKNMDDFALINEAYGSYFDSTPPARETVEVSRLPKDVNVEISCIAIK